MTQTIFTALLFAAMFAVAITLVMGIVAMFRQQPNKVQAEQSNMLMRLRVLFQAAALILLAILLYFR